ncbi:hypothetical protein DJ480_25260, partial [Pseudomonas sp. Leaf98]
QTKCHAARRYRMALTDGRLRQLLPQGFCADLAITPTTTHRTKNDAQVTFSRILPSPQQFM